MKALLIQFQKTPTPEIEAELTQLYTDMTNYSPNCPACIAGRRAFVDALNDARSGKLSDAAENMRAAFGSIAYKLGRFIPW